MQQRFLFIKLLIIFFLIMPTCRHKRMKFLSRTAHDSNKPVCNIDVARNKYKYCSRPICSQNFILFYPSHCQQLPLRILIGMVHLDSAKTCQITHLFSLTERGKQSKAHYQTCGCLQTPWRAWMQEAKSSSE